MAAGAALLTGCASEMPDDIEGGIGEGNPGDSCIEIFAGQPSASTRTINEPGRPGVCDADKVHLWFYRFAETAGSEQRNYNPGAGKLEMNSEATVSANRFGDLYAQNKLASYLYDFPALGYQGFNLYFYTTMAVPALAYTDSDAALFTTDSQGSYNQLSLQLNGTTTPELYFGRLKFPVNDNSSNATITELPDGMFYCYRHGSGEKDKTFENCPVNGKLYRIVSQMNVVMKDVPEGSVEKMELLVSEFPTEMTLFGNHGAFYHVSTASNHIGSEDTYISVATCDHFHNGEARLSTFLLPSDKGYKMRVRVWYKDAIYDENGNEVRYKDCDVRPSVSSLLTGDDAEVYFSGAADHLKAGNALYVYNDYNQLFYSYSNVRININGDYDNVLREMTSVNINVEVCPTFQKDHYFEID